MLQINSYNDLTNLPSDIALNTALEVLSASGNRISSFPNLSGLTKLKILELSDNGMTGIFPVATICQLGSIYILNLGNNRFSGTFYDACLKNLNPLIFDIAGPYPETFAAFTSLTGDVPKDLMENWSNIENGYFSVYQQFGLSGYVLTACIDLRFCYKSNFAYHSDLAWIAGHPGDVPQTVYDTIDLARTNQ
jgi:hypothetical protein